MAGKPIIKPSRIRASGAEHIFFFCLICLPTILFCIGIFKGNVHLYAGDVGDGANRLYLLSAIAQALAAILAVLVTLTLIATQLASQTFTPQIVSQRLRDPWFWGAIFIYGFAILWALFAKAQLNLLKNTTYSDWDRWSVDIALLSTGFAILYLVPFFIATLKGLKPATFVRRLLEDSLYDHLDDVMRRSINVGQVNMLEEALLALGEHAADELQGRPTERVANTKRFARQVTDIGKYACRRRDTESWEKTMRWLTELTTYCTEEKFRQAADIFNNGVDELYSYGLEHFSEKR